MIVANLKKGPHAMEHSATIQDQLHSKDFDFYYRDSEKEAPILFLPRYHYHDFHEIYCLLDGEVDYYVEDRSYHMQPGNIMLIHHHDIHHVLLNNPKARYERVFIYFDHRYLQDLSTARTDLSLCFSSINQRKSHFLPTTRNDVLPFIQDLQKLKETADYGNDIRFSQRFNDLLLFINQTFLTMQDKSYLLDNMQENQIVYQSIQYIQNHLSETVSVAELATALFISREHLTREFKRHTGFSPHAYIQKRKLIYAKERLLEGVSISKTASDAGFTNYSHFINRFKQEFGLTPRQFQLTYAQNNQTR